MDSYNECNINKIENKNKKRNNLKLERENKENADKITDKIEKEKEIK